MGMARIGRLMVGLWVVVGHSGAVLTPRRRLQCKSTFRLSGRWTTVPTCTVLNYTLPSRRPFSLLGPLPTGVLQFGVVNAEVRASRSGLVKSSETCEKGVRRNARLRDSAGASANVHLPVLVCSLAPSPKAGLHVLFWVTLPSPATTTKSTTPPTTGTIEPRWAILRGIFTRRSTHSPQRRAQQCSPTSMQP